MPREIDHGPGAEIEASFITKDERFASFVYKTYSEMSIYVITLQEPISLTKVQPQKTQKTCS